MKFLVPGLFMLVSVSLNAQTDSSTTILSKLYFPFDFGSSFNANSNIMSGSLVKTGLEYRLDETNGFYIRFNVDNRTSRFEIPLNETTNVTDGTITFNDLVIGPGFRFGEGKFRTFLLGQGGFSSYSYPMVDGSPTDYRIEDQTESAPIIKLTAGLEYYLARDAALVLEFGQYFHLDPSVFWENSTLNTTVVSFGMTTTLF